MKGMRLALLLAAAGLMLAVPAAAEDDSKPADPCAEAAELRQEIEDLAAQIQGMVDEAKPICARKRESRWAADECSKRQVEIDGFMRSLKELNAKRKAAEASCAKQKQH